jgi:hypothetical protein
MQVQPKNCHDEDKIQEGGKNPRLVAPAVTVEPYMRDVEGL